jgi:endonuclease/exonuclease/phosphatase family metal-dependent hydrolase
VAWSAVPFGKWPTRSFVSKWLPKRTRSSTFVMPAVPQPGDHMLGVAYANPVFGQLYARNARGTVRRSAGWVPVFPAAPDPGPGDPVRFGTYNVLGGPTGGARINAIAANIRDHGLSIVALQEANEQTSLAVTQALGSNWAYLHFQTGSVPSPPQQILYRTDSYRLLDKGTFPVSNTVDPSTPVVTPWARLMAVQASAASQSFLVTSVHEMDNTNRSVMDRKRDSGNFAREVMANVDRVNPGGLPVIVAGDLNYLREPFNDVPGYVEAPPTLVRGGYYDAMAALSKTNIAYSTFNGGNGMAARTQTAIRSGVAARSDYIMLKGFRGSNAYVNVANWSLNGLVPSDHNLVYADLTVPFK